MTEFFVFIYAMLAVFVIQAMRRSEREQRPTHAMVKAVGWGLFSLSSTLALLLGALAFALAMGASVPLASLS